MRPAVLLLSALVAVVAGGEGDAAGNPTPCEMAFTALLACDAPFMEAGTEPNPVCCGAMESLIYTCGGLGEIMAHWGPFTNNFADTSMHASHRAQEYIGRCPGPNSSEGACIAALQGVTNCVNASLSTMGPAYNNVPNMPNMPPTPAMLEHVSSQCCPSLISGPDMSVDVACMSFNTALEGYFQPAGPTATLYLPGSLVYLGFQNTSYVPMGPPNQASWGANPMVLNTSSTTAAQLMAAAHNAWPGPGPFPQGLTIHCADSMPGMSCYRWRVQYPSVSFLMESLQLVAAPASLSADGMSVMPPPATGIPAIMDPYYGGLDMPRQLTLFLLTRSLVPSSMPVFPLPNECRRFPEEWCDSIVARTMRCLTAHYMAGPQTSRLPTDPFCGGHIAQLVPDVCSGYAWRAKARVMQNEFSLPALLVERFMRAVETSVAADSHDGSPCNATVPSLKFTTDGILLTSQCAETPDEGFVCADPSAPQFVSPSTGIPYFAVSTLVHDTSKYRPMSPDMCHAGEFNNNGNGNGAAPNNL